LATGDIPDFQARLRANLPPWFPNVGSAPVIDAILTGIATLFANFYVLYVFAKAQTRILTSSGAFIDLIAWDYFGGRFTRLPGEGDVSFLKRVVAELIRARVTRAAIQSALVSITGYPVRIVEASVLTDVGFWKMRGSSPAPVSFWNVDTPGNPLRWSGRGLRCQFFVECVLPLTVSFGNNAMPAWGTYALNWMLRGTAGSRATGSSLISRGDNASTDGAQAVYDLINSMRAAGIICWVKFVPIPTATQWDQPGASWDSGLFWDR
jgi:hypothetical protein